MPLEQLAKSRGLPMKSLLLAAHCVTLQRLSGESDVTTGLVTHGRPGRAGAEVAAGLFLNTIPIRLDDGHGDLARRRRTHRPIRTREPSPSAVPVAGHAIRCGPPPVQHRVQLRQLPPSRRAGQYRRDRTARLRSARTNQLRAARDRRHRPTHPAAVPARQWRSPARHRDADTRIRKHIHACAGGNRTLTRAGHRSRHRR